MIIVDLSGGLGNQMFQYSCAKSLSLDLNLPLKIFYKSLNGQTIHNGYELERVFGLDLEFASDSDIEAVLGFFMSKSIFRRLFSKKPLNKIPFKNFFPENEFNYSPSIFSSVDSNAFIQGYWQTEKYFLKNKDKILLDFNFSVIDDEDNINSILISEIRSNPSVSIHIRRGDYLTNSKASATHGHCSIEYYLNAIDTLKKEIGYFHMFFFSDDPDWVDETFSLKFSNITIVRHNQGENSFNDMRLMSLCNHQIIANSTFSWWGAWLNSYPDKIVIAPKNWFANEEINSSDLIPDSWILL